MENKMPTPPKLASLLLKLFVSFDVRYHAMGDFEEIFVSIANTEGLKAAKRWYWIQLFQSIPSFLKDTTYWSLAMLRNYLLIAFRNLKKHKGYTAINISGLAIGLACSIAVLVFVRSENTFDNYHENKDSIYRVSIETEVISSGSGDAQAVTSILWGPTLKKDYPEVQDFVRFIPLTNESNPWVFTHQDNSFSEYEILYTDPSVFSVFSWDLIQGDPGTALSEPSTMVITQSMSRKYFGSENAIGKTIAIDPLQRDENGNLLTETYDYTVVGVIRDVPDNSHFTFDFLLPTENLKNIFGGDINTGDNLDTWFWRGPVGYTYLLLDEEADLVAMDTKLGEFITNYPIDSETRARGYTYDPYLQALPDIYLDGNIEGQLQPVGDRTQITMFAIIAIFILLIACINFMNYTTAHSTRRAHEVGMRKVLGAYRKQLIAQFLGESLLTSFISLLIAVALAWLILPYFYHYLGKPFFLNTNDALFLISSIGIIGLLTGFISGIYPAMFLSGFKPLLILKSSFSSKKKKNVLRKGLVVFQFSISVFLFVATLVVYNQLNYMKSYELGFEEEQLLILDSSLSQSLAGEYDAYRTTLLENPLVREVTSSSAFPGFGGGGDLYVREGNSADDGFSMSEAYVKMNFIDVMGLELIAGRNFSEDMALDQGIPDESGRVREVAVILNEEAVARFGWDSPEEAIGGQIIRDPNSNDFTATVVGVVRNFNYQSLHNSIEPLGIVARPNYRFIAVKIVPNDMQNAISFVEGITSQFVPNSVFDYTFLDQNLEQQYEEEQRTSEVFSYISFLAIFITSLGLFGLATFMTQQRTKEIGIRKVLGADTGEILYDYLKSFAILVFVSFIIGMPLAYYAATNWLSDFPFRINIGADIYLLAALFTFVIAFLTISYQTFKATRINPVEALKGE